MIKTRHSLFLKPRGLLFVNDCFKNENNAVFDNFLQSSNNEVVATSEYDILGRQTKLIDINAGTIEYKYNAFGDIIETINANGEVKTYTYDDFGRLIETNNNGFIVNYEYIETGNGINQVEKISAPNHEQLFEYDGLNRMIKTTETINGSSFEFAFAFNNLNQITTMEYPNGLVVTNVYDNNGYLDEVKKLNGDLIWKAEEQDAYGRYVEYSKGDGVTTELFFDAFQNLVEIEAGNVQHHLYNWDIETGNLNYRRDLIKQLEEDFLYDNLNRLTKATASPMGSILVLNQIETNYETNGNIKDKSDAGEYAYHPTKPNAVTGVSNDNLNISLLNQDITYNAFNKAETITEGDYTLQFLYGHDKQRRKTTFYENNVLTLEKYFVGLYEKEVEGSITRHINYITAGDGMTAIVLQEEESGDISEETYFTYKDHLGSIIALTDETGDVVLEQSFDACSVTLKFDDDNQSNFLVEPIPRSEQANREGRYRNPDDWTYNNILESPTWLRGYTGHEHLPHFDLINMNGRIYDPILGRMLSPDNYVQDPLFSQSYNRYSYVWNNPLRYTDPSGDIILALGLTYLGGVIANDFNFNPLEWDFNSRDTYVGMAAGAVSSVLLPKAAAWVAKNVSAEGVGYGLVSGTLNTMYEYESGNSFEQMAKDFGAGFVGGYTIAYNAHLVAMLVGGTANVLAGIGTYSEDSKGYEMSQRFIGGALVTYSVISMSGKANYMKMADGSYFGGSKTTAKAWRAGWINQASDFAYSSEEAFNSRSFTERFMMFASAMGTEAFASGWDELIKKELKNIYARGFATFGTRAVSGGMDYWLQQSVHHTFKNDPKYLPWQYKYGLKKTSMAGIKAVFYGLAVKPFTND